MSAQPEIFHTYKFYRSSNGKVFKCIGSAEKNLSAALVTYKDERSFTFSKKTYYFNPRTGENLPDYTFNYRTYSMEAEDEGTLQLPSLTEEQVRAVFLPWRKVRADTRPLLLD